MVEYRSETLPLVSLGAACNEIAAEGWRVLSVVGGLAAQAGPLSQPVPACVVLFQRETTADAAKITCNGIVIAEG